MKCLWIERISLINVVAMEGGTDVRVYRMGDAMKEEAVSE
jgi:hypothetical protein